MAQSCVINFQKSKLNSLRSQEVETRHFFLRMCLAISVYIYRMGYKYTPRGHLGDYGECNYITVNITLSWPVMDTCDGPGFVRRYLT